MGKITEEKIRKLGALAARTDEGIHKIRTGNLPKETKDRLAQDVVEAHFYFTGLTLEALKDRKLAEQLAPAFEGIEEKMVEYTDTLRIFSGIMRLKHNIEGKVPWRRCSQLALIAVENKDLAERLVPAFEREMEETGQSPPGVLSDLLKVRHGIKGKELPLPMPMKKLKKKVECWIEKAPCEEILSRHEQTRPTMLKSRTDEEARARQPENVMFR
jgi:hypothetical protein